MPLASTVDFIFASKSLSGGGGTCSSLPNPVNILASSSAAFFASGVSSFTSLSPIPLTAPVMPEIPPPPTAPRTPDSIKRLNSLLPHTSLFSPTNFSAAMLMASCVASVGPSVNAPVAPPATADLTIPGCIPDFSKSFSITPVFIPGVNCFRIYAGRIASSAAETDPANSEAPGAIFPVSSCIFWNISGAFSAYEPRKAPPSCPLPTAAVRAAPANPLAASIPPPTPGTKAVAILGICSAIVSAANGR